MIVLFADYALKPAKVDPDYAGEYAAAMETGFDVGFYSHEALVTSSGRCAAARDGRASRATRSCAGGW
jgi:hypothetical protein